VTGISDVAEVLSVKRLSLLKELLPNLKRVAMLWNRDDLGMSLRYKASAEAARAMGVTVQALGVREPNDFDGVFEAMDRNPPEAILMVSDALTVLNRKRVFTYAAEKRLPAIYESDPLVRDGGLMSYGADRKESFVRAAGLIASIFSGAKPADLPFEEPTRYLFVVNLKAARELGLVFPPTLLVRADDVVE
jgi:putative ABC transport system substrate-binding protein